MIYTNYIKNILKKRGENIMKLKHHLWAAFGIIIIALFLTSFTSVLEVAGVVEKSETDSALWDIAYDNLLTDVKTEDLVDDLAALGVDSATANVLIEKHDMGTSATTGLVALVGFIAAFGGLALVIIKEDAKKWIIYTAYGLSIVSVVALYLGIPGTIDSMEALFNEVMTGIMPLGTMMKDGTEVTLGLGFYGIILGSLYGIVALVLNQFGKIAE
jgi:putative effector of murein hydrolase LrgA (UPF0299 family)